MRELNDLLDLFFRKRENSYDVLAIRSEADGEGPAYDSCLLSATRAVPLSSVKDSKDWSIEQPGAIIPKSS